MKELPPEQQDLFKKAFAAGFLNDYTTGLPKQVLAEGLRPDDYTMVLSALFKDQVT